MSGSGTTQPIKLYVDSRLLAVGTEHSMETTANDSVIHTSGGTVVQSARETGQFTASFVVPVGDTTFTRIRNLQRDKKRVQVQIGNVGDATHATDCIVSTISVSSTVSDGSQTASVTFTHINQAVVQTLDIPTI